MQSLFKFWIVDLSRHSRIDLFVLSVKMNKLRFDKINWLKVDSLWVRIDVLIEILAAHSNALMNLTIELAHFFFFKLLNEIDYNRNFGLILEARAIMRDHTISLICALKRKWPLAMLFSFQFERFFSFLFTLLPLSLWLYWRWACVSVCLFVCDSVDVDCDCYCNECFGLACGCHVHE